MFINLAKNTTKNDNLLPSCGRKSHLQSGCIRFGLPLRPIQTIQAMRKYSAEIFSLLGLLSGIVLQSVGTGWFRLPAVAFGWYLCALLPVGLPVGKEAAACLRKGSIFNEYALMSLAVLGAFCIGEYPEGVAVMLFYSIGERFSDAATDKARSHIRSLLDIRPDRASVLREGRSVTVTPDTVQPGETIEVKPGERVPLDGTLLAESALFDTSALTGESLPRLYRRTESVPAGVIATDKAIRLRVTKPYAESTLSRMLRLVQDAAERKAPAERFMRRFARIYTPAVTAAALLIVLLPFLYSFAATDFTFRFGDWFYRALVFLVISCPCALVVSIPLGYFGGIGAAARQGILFKGGNFLDAITRINVVVFDKTGTLTQGRFRVQQTLPHEASEEELWRWIASLERQSSHPVAQAIVGEAERRHCPFMQAEEAADLPGFGLSGTIEGRKVLVGSPRLFAARSIPCPAGIEEMPETTVLCAVEGQYKGCLLLADMPKEDAKQTIDGLKVLNIDNIQMLSGDKQAIVANLAGQLGIGKAHGDLLPEEKARYVEQLKREKGNRVAFVGDGLNDAPVLALSDVGIAMGGLGSDMAIETADVVIQDDRPSRLLAAIRIGKQTRRIVGQNILLAFGVKAAVLLLGAGGIATLWEAVFADVGVALLAVCNALRLPYRNNGFSINKTKD